LFTRRRERETGGRQGLKETKVNGKWKETLERERAKQLLSERTKKKKLDLGLLSRTPSAPLMDNALVQEVATKRARRRPAVFACRDK
jgi:hypothetical protein